ncbi:MAG TPA: hypothetical protein VFJ58_30300 [Armatimonadota bacterium]|nr:hypothetical protein [Armatimonadota bacterium]
MPALTIRIFVSSPGDVGQERVISARVIERLQGEFAGYAQLEAILWEHEPLRATDHFQSQIATPSNADIVVCILWSRLGTRLPPDKFARPDGTPYASGTEWEFEDAANAFLLNGKPDLLVYRKLSDPLISSQDERAIERLEQKRALDRFIDHWFGNPSEGFKAAFTGFETPDEYEDLLEKHLRKLIKERLPERITGEDEDTVRISWFKGTPYRGLEAFDFEHASVFFGRTKAIGAVKEALIHQAAGGCAFVLVFGMSGGGKSSLVRAGVLPTITQPGVIEGVGLWRWAEFRPSDAAGDLFEGLAAALVSETALPELSGETAMLADHLRSAPQDAVKKIGEGLELAAQSVASHERLTRVPETRLALVVDQLEELFTRSQIDQVARERFAAAISALARSGLVWVIGTMRSDFYPRCSEIPELLALKEGSGSYDLQAPTLAEIGQMITFPTRAAGLRFEINRESGESLNDALLNAAARDPGALPLLEFTLDELFRQKTDDRVLTFAAYQSLGGLEGALAQRAEQVFQSLDAGTQAALPAVLRRLVTVGRGEESPATSQRLPLSAVATTPEQKALVEAFTGARLLVTDRADSGEAVVRLAHESLLHRWPRLQDWLAGDRDFLRVRARVSEAATRWRQEDQRPDFLLPPGKPLTEAEDMLALRRPDLSPDLIEFIERSKRKAVRAQTIRTRSVVGIAAVFLMVVSGFSLYSFGQAQRARAAAARAQHETLVAQQQNRLALKQKGLADQQRKAAEAQRLIAQRQKTAADVQRGIAQRQSLNAERQRRNAERQQQIAEAQRRIAEAQRAAAQQNFSHAVMAADTIVSDLAEGIKPIAGTQSSTVKKILESASGVYASLLRDAKTPAVLSGKARMLNSFVDIYLKLNDSGRAAASARDALEIFQKLAAADPKNPEYQAGVASSEQLLGKVLARQGYISRSHATYLAALAVRERLAARWTDNLDYQGDLGASLYAVGNIATGRHELDKAAALQQRALAIRERLAKLQPHDVQRLEDLGASQAATGDVAWYKDDHAGAGAMYEKALASYSAAAVEEPSNTEVQKGVGDTLLELAEVFQEQRDPTRAVNNLDKAIALSERYSRLDPHNAEWLDLLLNCQRVRADIETKPAEEKTDLQEQVQALREMNVRVGQLAREDPANANTQREVYVIQSTLATDRARLAELGVDPKSNLAAADQASKTALAVALHLDSLEPTDGGWTTLLLGAYNSRAEVAAAEGKPIAATSFRLKALQVWEGMLSRNAARRPDDTTARFSLAQNDDFIASMRQQLADQKVAPLQNLKAALAATQDARAAYQRLVETKPENRTWADLLARTYLESGLYHEKIAALHEAPADNLARAQQAERQAIVRYTRLAAGHTTDRTLTQQLSFAYNLLSVSLGGASKGGEALAAYQHSARLFAQLASDSSESAGSAPSSMSKSERAEQGLGSVEMEQSVLHEVVDTESLYVSQPTYANAKQFAHYCIELAALLGKTPNKASQSAAQKLRTTFQSIFQKLLDKKRLTPDQVKAQQPIFQAIDDAYAKVGG